MSYFFEPLDVVFGEWTRFRFPVRNPFNLFVCVCDGFFEAIGEWALFKEFGEREENVDLFFARDASRRYQQHFVTGYPKRMWLRETSAGTGAD